MRNNIDKKAVHKMSLKFTVTFRTVTNIRPETTTTEPDDPEVPEEVSIL